MKAISLVHAVRAEWEDPRYYGAEELATVNDNAPDLFIARPQVRRRQSSRLTT